MEFSDFFTLFHLAKAGALYHQVDISTKELGKQMKKSQQTVSRLLIDLEKKNLILREKNRKKHSIIISPEGRKYLKSLCDEMSSFFEKTTKKTKFSGKITSGFGEGAYYMQQKGYIDQIKKEFNFTPFPGTLNIIPDDETVTEYINKLKSYHLSGFSTKSRSFGSVRCVKAMLFNLPALIVFPERTHKRNQLEIVSPIGAKKEKNLHDGDSVDIYL